MRSEPALAVGSRASFTARFLGRRLEYIYEIVDLVPNERLVMRTADGPFPMETTYEWHRLDERLRRMKLRKRREPTGFSVLLPPLMAPAMRRANRNDLAKLRGYSRASSADLTRTPVLRRRGTQGSSALFADRRFRTQRLDTSMCPRRHQLRDVRSLGGSAAGVQVQRSRGAQKDAGPASRKVSERRPFVAVVDVLVHRGQCVKRVRTAGLSQRATCVLELRQGSPTLMTPPYIPVPQLW